MINFFVYLFVFYAMKLAPKTIDNKAHPFWRWCTDSVNRNRSKKEDWVFYKFWRISVRDLTSHPIKSVYAYSRIHPFVFRRMNTKG